MVNMYKHPPQKSIELFVRGIIDSKCDVLSHIKKCRKCKEYYKEIGGKKEVIYNPKYARRTNDPVIC